MVVSNTQADAFKRLYYEMLCICIVEEKIVALYPEQEMRCPVHLCIGQEAVAVGVCANLSRDDYVLSGHRSHGHYLAKGGDLRAMMTELYGKVTGCAQGKGGSMHLVGWSTLGVRPEDSAAVDLLVSTPEAGVAMRRAGNACAEMIVAEGWCAAEAVRKSARKSQKC